MFIHLLQNSIGKEYETITHFLGHQGLSYYHIDNQTTEKEGFVET